MQICYCRSIIADMNVNFPPEMGNDSKDGIVGDRPSSTNGKVQNHLRNTGVFLEKTKNAFIFAKRIFKQEEYFRYNHWVIFLFLCNGVGTKNRLRR